MSKTIWICSSVQEIIYLSLAQQENEQLLPDLMLVEVFAYIIPQFSVCIDIPVQQQLEHL